MKYLVCGDPHIKLNRLDDGRDFSKQMLALIDTTKPDALLVLGDLFDSFAVIRSEILALWADFLIKAGSKTQIMLVVGNHDMAGAEGGVSALETFKVYPNVTVYDSNTPALTADGQLYILPFVRENAEFEAIARKIPSGSILICHQSFQGAQFENGMYDPHGADTGSVAHLKAVISGHVHKQQKFANIWYPGTPFQHTFGDVGEIKGVFEISVTNKVVEELGFHTLDMPTFEIINADTLEELAEKLPSPNFRTHYKVVARGAPAEIALFWNSEKARRFKSGSKRVVDALTSINPTAQVVKVEGANQSEKLKNYVESKEWRTKSDRVLDRAARLIERAAGR